MKIIVALYEPELFENTDNIMRLCACFNVELYIIQPMRFVLKDLRLPSKVHLLDNFNEFVNRFKDHRKILFTPHTNCYLHEFKIKDNDILCFGRESDGMEIQNMMHFHQLLAIQMPINCRSFNLDTSVAIALSYVKIML